MQLGILFEMYDIQFIHLITLSSYSATVYIV